MAFAYSDVVILCITARRGLRDVPTFIVNLMTQWGTVLMYFKMPCWVKDFKDSIVEKPGDPDDVRALKVRFLYPRVTLVCFVVLISKTVSIV
jgi:hypothetical protein